MQQLQSLKNLYLFDRALRVLNLSMGVLKPSIPPSCAHGVDHIITKQIFRDVAVEWGDESAAAYTFVPD